MQISEVKEVKGMLSFKDVAQPFFDNLNTRMKKIFIQKYGIDFFFIHFPSGSMDLINITDQGKLYISTFLFCMFKEEIEAGKDSRSWFCILMHGNALSFHLKNSQEVMEAMDTITMRDYKEEVLSVCKTFEPNEVIPVMFVIESPDFTHTVVGAYSIPW